MGGPSQSRPTECRREMVISVTQVAFCDDPPLPPTSSLLHYSSALTDRSLVCVCVMTIFLC